MRKPNYIHAVGDKVTVTRFCQFKGLVGTVIRRTAAGAYTIRFEGTPTECTTDVFQAFETKALPKG
ncbi:MAG: hypothetical protein GY882_02005 [Actinomycetia bacterium]|nr:hypothetical protein [Actinomycetes bacterium]MCP4845243.1 hypothetical protein [Actinomycetes bacterium]